MDGISNTNKKSNRTTLWWNPLSKQNCNVMQFQQPHLWCIQNTVFCCVSTPIVVEDLGLVIMTLLGIRSQVLNLTSALFVNFCGIIHQYSKVLLHRKEYRQTDWHTMHCLCTKQCSHFRYYFYTLRMTCEEPVSYFGC